jgi:2-keto-3-deoxy-6-phosphogluconate aldolase
MPGCATASEAVALADLGFAIMKFFPAGPSGGPAWLKGVGGPLPQLRFCPTGGVDAKNAADYLALPNVVCVGRAAGWSPRQRWRPRIFPPSAASPARRRAAAGPKSG